MECVTFKEVEKILKLLDYWKVKLISHVVNSAYLLNFFLICMAGFSSKLVDQKKGKFNCMTQLKGNF